MTKRQCDGVSQGKHQCTLDFYLKLFSRNIFYSKETDCVGQNRMISPSLLRSIRSDFISLVISSKTLGDFYATVSINKKGNCGIECLRHYDSQLGKVELVSLNSAHTL